MHAATDRLEFAPPPTPGAVRSLVLAVLAHIFLVAALTWGVHWKNEAVIVTAEAELWSAVPQQAAPKLVEVPPEPPAITKPPVVAKSLPTPPTPPKPPQVQPKLADADIALEREKLRLKKEKQQELENQRLEKLKQEKVDKLKQEKLKLKLEKLKQEKLLLDKKQLQEKREQDKREQDKKAAEDKKKAAQDSKRKEALQDQQDAKKVEAQRTANLKRMAGLAGATGSSGSTGTALRSSGPSASYAGKIVERIKSNTTFTDSSAGKPSVIVLVRAASGGAILSRHIVTPSGNKAWDDAVLRAIDKMDTLPRDVDGKIPEKVLNEGLELKVSL
ncbi:MAG: cell envelope integrity protein TolA [Rhodoferax sp.]|uniref:cell envelope integrity protein TolA n=1 Tax=Rhodoferax sp. TaxID=50421 RepID=UPI0017B52EB9|nr:cell envelope integrity protein TolA [Rhodoferax sp.]NMM19709.1 cell envelope integrity protein TolA [Rhodoferax sp.]